MLKSVMTLLGLFLMVSLIILSTIGSLIGNINFFSNVMATNSNKHENSQAYESYYSDGDNKYRATYGYYSDQQQQHHQQQQSSYNDYDYNTYKKITSNNSYDSDKSKYSKYPTKDNKLACKTGQFEGFFVESAEFCNLEIAQGPSGPQGPPGLLEINSTNLYSELGNVTTNGGISFAICDTNDVIFEGGYRVVSFAAETGDIINTILNGPSLTSPSTYQVQLISNDEGLLFQAFAYCFDNVPSRP